MTFKLPDRGELKTLAASMGLSVDDTLAEAMLEQLAMFGGAYQFMDQLEDHLPDISYPQRSHRAPGAQENPLGAWYVRTDLKGRDSGPLKGRTVALKDNIFVANIPMMNGASIMEGFIPDFDATVVTRLLDAGAEITGKAVCEFLCVSGGSATASTVLSATRIITNTLPAVLLQAAPPWWPTATWTWPWAVTRPVRCGYRPVSAGSTD